MRRGELLALTLWRPWAWAVAAGIKRIENRGWRPPQELINGRIAIHAGERWDDDGERFLRGLGLEVPSKARHVAGAVLGLVTLRGFVWQYDVDAAEQRIRAARDRVEPLEVRGRALAEVLTLRGLPADQARFYFGPCGWIVSDHHELTAPVKVRGMQRLWRLPPTAAAEVLARL